MLKNVRDQFLRPRNVKVRVLLTGRPSYAVERSQFLRDETPVLTVREYTGEQLDSYITKVRSSVERCAFATNAVTWQDVNWDNLRRGIESHRQDRSQLDILGLPLLAHLSLSLLAHWEGGPHTLLSNRTALYRNLLDLTCVKAGKASSDPDDLLGQARIRGIELRRILQQTALAITAYGNESIPFRELQLRLKKSRKQTMIDAESVSKERPLTSLMISFYFKGGREHLGCEFLHKSFREYLYAETIVEALKEYGRKQLGSLARRKPYWKDFHESDLRRQLSRDLSRILCPYALSTETRAHVSSLLAWEVERSRGEEQSTRPAQPLDSVSFAQWEIIRDGLADL
jgi:hypothetical protein